MLHLTSNNRKWIKIIAAVAVVLALLVGFMVTRSLADGPECNPCDGYSVEILQATHIGNEPGFDDVLWEYTVTASDNSKDVSHTTVEVGQCYEVTSCGPEPCARGLDPTTNVDGVKWDVEIPAGESLTLWFVTRIADGNTKHGLVEAAVKAGQDVCYFQVDGPVCSPNQITLKDMSATNNSDNITIAVIALIFFASLVAIVLMERR